MTVYFVDSASGQETVLGTVDLEEEKWEECEMTINASGKGRLKFASSMRQFLDEVKVAAPASSGIDNITVGTETADKRIYSIDGRYLGDDLDRVGHGLYIVGGKKVLK